MPPVTIDGTSGITTPMYNGTITANAVTPSVNMKNRIINGNMSIDQRNAGAAVTTDGAYVVDRFSANEDTDGAYSAQRDTNAPVGFVNSLKWTTTTADSSLGATQYAGIAQSIEGFNVADLNWGTANAKTVTLSFWVRSSLTGTFGGSFRNSANNRSYPFTYSISVADTWEYETITIAGDTSGTWLTDNGAGLKIHFGLGVGSTFSGTAGAWAGSNFLSATGAVSVIGTINATWFVTGVQLEVGSTATSFDYRPYGTELALCQRYFYLVGAVTCGYYSNNTSWYFAIPYSMRATVTASLQGTFVADNLVGANGGTVSSITVNSGRLNGGEFYITVTGASGPTTGSLGNIYGNTDTSGIALSAEL